MRRSRQRDAVTQALCLLDHPTAEEIHSTVRDALPRTSLATVYRNLDNLVRSGQARVRSVEGQRRFDHTVAPHGHLHCIGCKRLVDIPLSPSYLGSVAAAAGRHSFTVEDHVVEVQGRCASCASGRGSRRSGSVVAVIRRRPAIRGKET